VDFGLATVLSADNSGRAYVRKVKAKSRSIVQYFRSLTTGLSGQLLLLTVIFVFIAEVLIFMPSIANMRLAWLRDRLSTATSVGQVIDALQADLPRDVQDATLRSMGVELIALRKADTSRLLAAVSRPPTVDAHFDLRHVNGIEAIYDAIAAIAERQPKTIRVIGEADGDDTRIEIVMNSKPLRDAMLSYLANVTLLAIALSIIIGSLIFVSFNHLFVQPIRRLSGGMRQFSERPDDPTRIFKASVGSDELDIAGQQLAQMQESLYFALKQRKNLADLGLAVSKINHDLRNILSSAQLMSDRLVDVHDPLVKSFAPRLVRTLDRAVSYTDELLSFGKTNDHLPKRQEFHLRPLASEVREVVLLGLTNKVDYEIEIDEALTIFADSEHIFRIIYNLSRNAVQALDQDRQPNALGRRLIVSSERLRNVVNIVVDDNGPGMPAKAREHLFAPFKGSVRAGGTGLGLVIVRELVLAHGGTIALVEKLGRGTQFRIEIPDEQANIT
jgi:signal transduction histidine kinase